MDRLRRAHRCFIWAGFWALLVAAVVSAFR